MIQLTLTLKMTTAQVFEMSVTVNNNSPIPIHPDDQTQPIMTIFSVKYATNVACEQQTYFRSSLLSLRKIIMLQLTLTATYKDPPPTYSPIYLQTKKVKKYIG